MAKMPFINEILPTSDKAKQVLGNFKSKQSEQDDAEMEDEGAEEGSLQSLGGALEDIRSALNDGDIDAAMEALDNADQAYSELEAVED